MIETWGFYLCNATDANGDPLSFGDYQRFVSARLDLWSRCEDLGFDGLAFAEHHWQPRKFSPSPHLLVAALAGRTNRLRFTTLGVVLSMHYGWRFAEECGMLDYITDGRFEPGITAGSGPHEAVLSGNIRAEETRARYYSAAEVLFKAMKSSSVTHDDDFHHLEDNKIVPQMRPGVGVWGTAMSRDSAAWCGDRGIKMCTTFLPTDEIAILAATYREAASAAGHSIDPSMLGVRRRVFVADSDAEAREKHEEAVDLVAIVTDEALGETGDPTMRARMNQPDDFVIGSPSIVAEILIEQCRAGGYGKVFCFPDFRAFKEEDQVRNHELLGQKVAPLLRSVDVGTGR